MDENLPCELFNKFNMFWFYPSLLTTFEIPIKASVLTLISFTIIFGSSSLSSSPSASSASASSPSCSSPSLSLSLSSSDSV